jgi:glutaconate CoA-transferase subunit B
MSVRASASEGNYTTDEMMTVAASRELGDGAVCFVGIGLPSEAANLARATHAPNCFLIYESGTLGAKPDVLPLSIGDGVLAEHADSVVPVPEVFNYWLQAGRVDVGFLGAAQMDRFANINTTVVGPYEQPKVRLPGAGGAPEIAASAREVIIMLRHKRRAFVEELSFVTSVGHGRGGASLTALHPGATVEAAKEATGWDLKVAEKTTTTDPPTDEELAVLRDLRARTEAARRGAG